MGDIGLTWKGVGILVGLFTIWSALLVSAIKWLLDRYQHHIDGRFESLEEAQGHQDGEWRRVERELLQLRAELPEHYVRREDHIRTWGVIDAKQDTLRSEISRLNASVERALVERNRETGSG